MSSEVLAPMPGKIIEILVNEGDEVFEFQEVVILEAMKMENAIPTTVAGKIKKNQSKCGRYGGYKSGLDANRRIILIELKLN